MPTPTTLLMISNGHGEDAIAAALVGPLRAQGFDLEALPIVGDGDAYRRLGVPIIGPTAPMPSGGFVYGRPTALARDLAGGLVGLTLGQIAAIRAARGRYAGVVAIGDVVVLAFAWLSKVPFCFVGCAKSDHYLGGRPGSYLWHERRLLAHPRCRGIYPRDAVTTENLRRLGLAAEDLGNPMMDGLTPSGAPLPGDPSPASTVAILPGSRPEAAGNLRLLADAARSARTGSPERNLRFLIAVAPGLPAAALVPPGWRREDDRLIHPDGTVLLPVAGRFADVVHAADLALAMAGTATEQLVGLGKPAISLAGPGPQFTAHFAEAQTRLLGPSVVLASSPAEAGAEVGRLLADPDRRAAMAANGRARMGPAGASNRIAAAITAALA